MKINLFYMIFAVSLILSSCIRNISKNQAEKNNYDIIVEDYENNIPQNQIEKDNMNNLNKKTIGVMSRVELDDKFEKFNIEWLHKNATEKSSMGKDFHYEYTEENNAVFIFMSGNHIGGYHFIQFYLDDYFALVKNYYVNGNIKEKGFNFNMLSASTSFKKGTWYYFNEDGQLIRTTNYDEPFKFTFDDLLAFCRKEKIEIDKGDPESGGIFHTEIRRTFSEMTGDCQWIITYEKTGIIWEEITLDGKFGKIISRKELAIEGP